MLHCKSLQKLKKIIMTVFIFITSMMVLSAVTWSAEVDFSLLKIAPPPNGGIYIGQYEWQSGDINNFEQAIGKKTAWFSRHNPWEMREDGHPTFDPNEAEEAWQDGKIVIVEAYEAYPNPDEIRTKGFTIDKLLHGNYDVHLNNLADQFRKFGKPMFFLTAREPNGANKDYFGGFGPDGDRPLFWALKNKKGFAEFDPSKFPNAQLYKDLGKPNVSDGVERLVAAQRYYFNFFVEKEGLRFLTFDTMGWASFGPEQVAIELDELPSEIDQTHARKLLESSYDFRNFYPGDKYVDWVSINFYMVDYLAKDWEEFSEDIILPNEFYFSALKETMTKIREVAPAKPVYFLEFGLPDGMNRDSQLAADKITAVFEEIITEYPEIHGFSMWSYSPYWANKFPWDCLIRPNTKQAASFQKVISDNPDRFHSCVYFSDGSRIPTCETISPPTEFNAVSE